MNPGAFAGGPQQQIADLYRQIADIKRRLPAGVGVTTSNGATEVRATQVGFPAELTSAWSSSTGYSWKQLVLSGVSLTNPSVQRTGDGAVAVDGSTSLTSGTKGWLEVDPQAGGWLFVPASSGGSAAVSSWKEPVRVATTTAGTLATSFENGDTVDGVVLATGNRILIKNQSTASENGIYTVNASGAPTRATDADSGSEVLGATVAVTEGDRNADTVWLCTANAPITVGTTGLPWAYLGPPTAGGGSSGAAVSLDTDNTYYTSNFSLSLPGPGTYVVTIVVNIYGAFSGASLGHIDAQIYNSTAATAVTADLRTTFINSPGGLSIAYAAVPMVAVVSVTAATLLKARAKRISGSGLTWSYAGMQDPGGNNQAHGTYIRVG